MFDKVTNASLLSEFSSLSRNLELTLDIFLSILIGGQYSYLSFFSNLQFLRNFSERNNYFSEKINN